jgi:hypothetical protein
MKVLADDGSEMEIGPGEAYIIPRGISSKAAALSVMRLSTPLETTTSAQLSST